MHEQGLYITTGGVIKVKLKYGWCQQQANKQNNHNAQNKDMFHTTALDSNTSASRPLYSAVAGFLCSSLLAPAAIESGLDH